MIPQTTANRKSNKHTYIYSTVPVVLKLYFSGDKSVATNLSLALGTQYHGQCLNSSQYNNMHRRYWVTLVLLILYIGHAPIASLSNYQITQCLSIDIKDKILNFAWNCVSIVNTYQPARNWKLTLWLFSYKPYTDHVIIWHWLWRHNGMSP
jgi:hypothetical protein